MVKNVLENGIWHNSDLDKNAAYKDDRIAIVDSIPLIPQHFDLTLFIST